MVKRKLYVQCGAKVCADVDYHTAIGHVDYGDQVWVVGEERNGYLPVFFDSHKGYLPKHVLTETPVRVHAILHSDVDNQLLLDIANAWLNVIPESVLSMLEDKGWKIQITDKDLDKEFCDGQYAAFGGLAGLTRYQERIVYLWDNPWSISGSICHEIGHVLDYLFGMPSQSEAFRMIYMGERDQFHDSTSVGDGHEVSSSLEYFASVFSEYVRNRDKCCENVPRSAEFIGNFVRKCGRTS